MPPWVAGLLVGAGCALLYAVVSVGWWVLGYFLVEVRNAAVAGVAGLVLVAPYSVVLVAGCVAWLTGHRLAPIAALPTLTPLRVVAAMALVRMGPLEALLAQGPLAVFELVGGMVAVLLLGSPVVRFERGAVRPVPAVLAAAGTAVTVAGLFACSYLGYRLGLSAVRDLLGMGREPVLFGFLVLPVLASAAPVALSAAVVRGGLFAGWVGAMAGAAAIGLVYAGATAPGPLVVPGMAGVPVVFVGSVSLVGGFAGSVVQWLWAMSADSEEDAVLGSDR